MGSKFARLLTVFAALCVSACVSDTLSQQQTQPQPLVQTREPSYDLVQREQAVAEIRAKSEAPASDELTNAFANADGPNAPMTSQEQAEKIAELKAEAEAGEASIEDAELVAKRRSIEQLRREASSHYKDAVKQIEN